MLLLEDKHRRKHQHMIVFSQTTSPTTCSKKMKTTLVVLTFRLSTFRELESMEYQATTVTEVCASMVQQPALVTSRANPCAMATSQRMISEGWRLSMMMLRTLISLLEAQLRVLMMIPSWG